MQQSVLFDIAETSFMWWYCWPASILLLALIFPLLAYLFLGNEVTGKKRRKVSLVCGGVAAAIIFVWMLFVGTPTVGEYLRYRQMRAERNSQGLVEVEGVFVGGMTANSELGGDSALTTFVVRDDTGVQHSFAARLTESKGFSDLQPYVSRNARLRVSYVPRASGETNRALRVVLIAKSAP